MRIIDEKYQTDGNITKIDGTPLPPDEPLILFRGHDNLLVTLLETYLKMCKDSGSNQRHITLLENRITTIKKWQEDNKDKIVTPGTNS